MKKKHYEPEISSVMCDGCGMCVAVCPQDVLCVKRDQRRLHAAVRFSFECVGCGLCEAICPKNAICVCSNRASGLFIPVIG